MTQTQKMVTGISVAVGVIVIAILAYVYRDTLFTAVSFKPQTPLEEATTLQQMAPNSATFEGANGIGTTNPNDQTELATDNNTILGPSTGTYAPNATGKIANDTPSIAGEAQPALEELPENNNLVTIDVKKEPTASDIPAETPEPDDTNTEEVTTEKLGTPSTPNQVTNTLKETTPSLQETTNTITTTTPPSSETSTTTTTPTTPSSETSTTTTTTTPGTTQVTTTDASTTSPTPSTTASTSDTSASSSTTTSPTKTAIAKTGSENTLPLVAVGIILIVAGSAFSFARKKSR